MGLFKLPKREEIDVQSILAKTKEEFAPKVVVKGGGETLLSKLNAIKKDVEIHLGKDKDKYLCITSEEEFIKYCQQAVKDGLVAIDTETDSLDSIKAHLVGVCLYSKSQKPAYVPVGHISVITEQKVQPQVSIEAITEGMKILKQAKCVFHNAYYDLVVIYQNTGVILKVYWDTLIASNLLDENESHSLKDLYIKYILDGKDVAHYFKDLFKDIPFCYIPYDIGRLYATKDAEMTLALTEFQLPYLTPGTEECEEYDLSRVARLYYEDLLPMIPILVDMKLTGMLFDFEKAKQLKEKYLKLKEQAIIDFNKSLEPFKRDIEEYGLPYPLNYNSSEQIRVLFYDIAKIGVVYHKEPRGTGKDVQKAILEQEKFKNKPIREVAQTLIIVKRYDKVISSFIDKLTKDALEHNGKIHANLNLCGTRTGRLSSSEPNQQQLPSKMKDIRQMFYAGEGNVIIGCDFSKQEPCLLSSACKDKKLIEVFHSGLDIYSKIASMIYDCPYEECLEKNPDGTDNNEGKYRRDSAKKVVLSIMYSKGEKTLAEDLNSTTEKAKEIMDAILKAYPDMKKWMDKVVSDAQQKGYADNLFGRRRRWAVLTAPKFEFYYIGVIDKSTEKIIEVPESTKKYYISVYKNKIKKARWKQEIDRIIKEAKAVGVRIVNNEGAKAEAMREIVNFFVQGSAAVITMRAMRNIYNNKTLRKYGCKLIMSIHDKLKRSCRV